jgi:hypothetical protein
MISDFLVDLLCVAAWIGGSIAGPSSCLPSQASFGRGDLIAMAKVFAPRLGTWCVHGPCAELPAIAVAASGPPFSKWQR